MVLLEPTAAEKAALKKQQKEEKKRNRSFFSHITTWTIRLLLFFIVVIGIVLFLLSRINGESPEFKASLEKYIAEQTPYRVKIGELNKFSVLPQFVLDVEDIQVYDQRSQTQLLTLGALHLSSSTLDLISKSKTVKNFYIDELRLNTSITGGSAVFIEEAYFLPPSQDQGNEGLAPFMIHAFYQDLPITIQTAFDYARQGDGSYSYSYKSDAPASIEWLDNTLSFNHQTDNQERKLSDLKLVKADQELPLITGDILLRNAGVHADLTHGDATYKAVLKFGSALTGSIVLNKFDLSKVSELTALLPQKVDEETVEPVEEEEQPIALGDSVVKIDVELNDFRNGDLVIGSLQSPISLENGALTLSKIQGSLFDGDIKGSISFDSKAKADSDSLIASLNLRGLNYEQFSPKIKGGNASLKVELTSQGLTQSALLENLNGNISYIGAQATMPVSALHFWGNGLVNALLPSIDKAADTTVNCAIANFKVKSGIASTQSLFLDTKRLTVVGDGHISLPDQKIKIKLKPSSKDTSLLKFDTAIKISGDLSDPSIGPDPASLGITGLKALAGVINPALLIVTMGDLGLSENHPCHKFLPEQKKEHEDMQDQKKLERTEALQNKEIVVE